MRNACLIDKVCAHHVLRAQYGTSPLAIPAKRSDAAAPGTPDPFETPETGITPWDDPGPSTRAVYRLTVRHSEMRITVGRLEVRGLARVGVKKRDLTARAYERFRAVAP